MIDEDRTMQLFLYTSDELPSGSHNPLAVVCEGCGTPRVALCCHHKEGDLCRSCAQHKRWSDPAERKKDSMSQLKRYEDPTEREKTRAANLKRYEDPIEREKTSKTSKVMWEDPEFREKRDISIKKYWEDPTNCAIVAKRWDDPEYRKRACVAMEKGWADPVARRRASAAKQHIPYDEWESFAKDHPYCPKFNEACRESNREKYDRRCFLSDTTEDENGQKLSVHHYDMNKQQGCDGHAWKLVPLCRKLHNTSHTPTWTARIIYLLEHVWTAGRNNVVS